MPFLPQGDRFETPVGGAEDTGARIRIQHLTARPFQPVVHPYPDNR